MNVKDCKTIHLKKMTNQTYLHINKGFINIFRFSKISSFSINTPIMSTSGRGDDDMGLFLLKSYKNHTPWIVENAQNHTPYQKKPYTLESVFPERDPYNKVSAKLIRLTKESVKRSNLPTFQHPKKDKEKRRTHQMERGIR